jgi:hypothetical protein
MPRHTPSSRAPTLYLPVDRGDTGKSNITNIMGDHITGGQYLFFLGRGECLLLLAVVGDLASTLPCGEQSVCVG